MAFANNIIFNNQGKAFALYKLESMPWDFFPLERREMAVGTMESILSSFSGTGQILLLWEDLEMNENAYLKRNGASVFQDEMARHARSARTALTSGARVLRRYILLELPTSGAVSNWQEFMTQARDNILKAMLSIRPQLPPTVKHNAEAAEKELYGRLKKHDLQRASFKDLDFMIRRTISRSGLLSPPLPDRSEGIFTPAIIAAFSDGAVMDESINHVKLNNGQEEHYQAFVHFTDYPQALPPYGYNLFSINEFSFSFDTVIHFKVLAPHQALQKTETKRRLLTAQMQEAYSSGEMTSLTEEGGLADSRVLEAKLESGKSLASIAVCMAVSHSDKKELNVRVSQLQTHFLSRNYRAVRPSAKQLESLLSFLPGSQPSAPQIECDPGFIAAMGPNFAVEVGDPRGFFIGWSGQTPVFWEPGRAAKELNKTNAVLISGSLGGGKSVAAKLMAYCTLLNGGYVLAIDPKEEYHSFRTLFEDRVNVVDLTPRGGIALNPFTFSENDLTAKTIAQNYLSLALNATGKENRILAISQAIEQLYERPQQDMDVFINCLNILISQSPSVQIREEARQCMFLLESMKRTDIGRMVFGHDNIRFFSRQQRMVDINIKEIPRPGANINPSQYTESERQGMALIYLITAIARETAFGLPRHIPKMLLIDESWVIVSLNEGERLVDEIIRVGRSYNLIPVLISQNITDLNKPVFINNSSQVFCFRALSSEEARVGLRILGADQESVQSEIFAKLRPGQCLFRDAEGRIGWLEIEPQPKYLVDEIFNSNPNMKAG